MTEPKFVDYIQGLTGDYSREDAKRTYELFKATRAAVEPIRGRLIHSVYADSRYTHYASGVIVTDIKAKSRKLKTTFTCKPCKIIKPPGEPTLIPGLFYD